MTDEELLRAMREGEVANDDLSQMQLTLVYGLHGEGRIVMRTRVEDGQARVYWRMAEK